MRKRFNGFLLLAVSVASTASAQTSNFSLRTEPNQQPPSTLTLTDALTLAAKNDSALRAATTDAEVARQDLVQSRTALYPSLSGRSEYLGSQGNGKVPTRRFV